MLDASATPAAPGEIEGALLIIGEGRAAGTCWVTVPEGWDQRFDALGRDDDGGFLRAEDGSVMRIPNVDADALDELLSKDLVCVHEFARDGSPRHEYEVSAIAYGSEARFGA